MLLSIIVKAEGPSGAAKIDSDNPKHALDLVQYLRTIGYNAWIEDANGNEIDEKALKMAIVSLPGCTFLLIQLAAFHQRAAYVGRLQRRVFGR